MPCVALSCLCSEFCSRGRFQISPVFVLTSGSCGGPEWAERTAFKSKPIGHISVAATPSPHTHPPLSHPGASSRTDDVTDCCEHCFHGNANHRFGLHFRQLSFPSFCNTPAAPRLPPSLRNTCLMRGRGLKHKREDGGRRGWGRWAAVGGS